jgi:hypothetical protein
MSCFQYFNWPPQFNTTQIFEETSRYQQQSMAFRVLQQRLMDRERAYDKLHKALIGRFGEDEVLKLTGFASDEDA